MPVRVAMSKRGDRETVKACVTAEGSTRSMRGKRKGTGRRAHAKLGSPSATEQMG